MSNEPYDMRNLLLEIGADGVRLSRLHKEKGPLGLDFIHDPVLNCYLEVLVEGRSMGDVILAIGAAVQREGLSLCASDDATW